MAEPVEHATFSTPDMPNKCLDPNLSYMPIGSIQPSQEDQDPICSQYVAEVGIPSGHPLNQEIVVEALGITLCHQLIMCLRIEVLIDLGLGSEVSPIIQHDSLVMRSVTLTSHLPHPEVIIQSQAADLQNKILHSLGHQPLHLLLFTFWTMGLNTLKLLVLIRL